MLPDDCAVGAARTRNPVRLGGEQEPGPIGRTSSAGTSRSDGTRKAGARLCLR